MIIVSVLKSYLDMFQKQNCPYCWIKLFRLKKEEELEFQQ